MNNRPIDVHTGEIYLLGNTAMQGFYKIGSTTRSVEARIEELSRSTAVPAKFYPIVVIKAHKPGFVETIVHSKLASHRQNKRREFFVFDNDTDAATSFLREVADSGVYVPATTKPPIRAVTKPESKPVSTMTDEEKKQSAAMHLAHLRSIVSGNGVAK